MQSEKLAKAIASMLTEYRKHSTCT